MLITDIVVGRREPEDSRSHLINALLRRNVTRLELKFSIPTYSRPIAIVIIVSDSGSLCHPMPIYASLKHPVVRTRAAGNSNGRYPTPVLAWIRSGGFSRRVLYLRTFAPVPPTVGRTANPRRGRRREAYATTAKPILAGAPAFYTEKTL